MFPTMKEPQDLLHVCTLARQNLLRDCWSQGSLSHLKSPWYHWQVPGETPRFWLWMPRVDSLVNGFYRSTPFLSSSSISTGLSESLGLSLLIIHTCPRDRSTFKVCPEWNLAVFRVFLFVHGRIVPKAWISFEYNVVFSLWILCEKQTFSCSTANDYAILDWGDESRLLTVLTNWMSYSWQKAVLGIWHLRSPAHCLKRVTRVLESVLGFICKLLHMSHSW